MVSVDSITAQGSGERTVSFAQLRADARESNLGFGDSRMLGAKQLKVYREGPLVRSSRFDRLAAQSQNPSVSIQCASEALLCA